MYVCSIVVLYVCGVCGFVCMRIYSVVRKCVVAMYVCSVCGFVCVRIYSVVRMCVVCVQCAWFCMRAYV